MNLLVIVPEQLPVPPITGGSVETCVHNICKRMSLTDRVTLISPTHPKLPASSSFNKGNYKILRVQAPSPKQYIRSVLRKVQGNQYDMIQIENRPTFVTAVRKAFPNSTISLSLHSLTFMSKLSQQQAYSVLKQVTGVVTVVAFLADAMKKKYPKYAFKFRSAILGVDTNKFKPVSDKEKRRIRQKWGVNGSYNVLFVGRIVPKKGLHTLVHAVAKVKRSYPNTKLIAVGSSWPGKQQQTPYMRKVKRLSKQLAVPIRFTGYIPPTKVNQMYSLGDVFVCPTQYREGFATVNSEAMASGIPVIASSRGGIREVIQHRHTGLLVGNYRSPQAFASAMLEIRRNPPLARKLSNGGRRAVKTKLSWMQTVRTLRKHYRKWKTAL